MKKIISQNQTVMEKYTNEELLEVLPSSLRESKELTTKQKAVLGQLIIYNGLEITKKDGYFYRSNKDLCEDCKIQEKTLIAAVNKLVMLGFIERKSGSRKDGASLYRINQKMIADYSKTLVENYSKKEIENYSKTPIDDYSNDYSKQIAEMTNRIKELEITVKTLVEKITVIEGKNYSTESDTEKEKEKQITSISINAKDYKDSKDLKEKNISINAKDLIEKKQTEEETKPSTYKTLGEYYGKKIKIEAKGKTLQELEQLQETYKHEIEHEYSHIMNSKNIYLYAVKPCMERLKDKLLENEFSNCMVITSIED